MKRQHPLKVIVALSGAGRTLQNLLEVQRRQRSEPGYEVVGVISSRENCGGVTIARREKIPVFTAAFGHDALDDLTEGLYRWIDEQEGEWIALCGFLKPFPLTDLWQNRIINIHPALLPAFGGKGMYGMHVHRAVAAAGVKRTGATIHMVTANYDEGQPIARIGVPLRGGESAEEIAALVFAGECQLYPEVLNRIARGELPAKGPLELELEPKEPDHPDHGRIL